EVPCHVGRLERQRTPDLIEGAVEGASRWQDSDHRVRLIVQQNGFPDNLQVRAELIHPQNIAQNNDAVFSQLVFVRQEGASQHRLNTENIEIPSRHARAVQEDRLGQAR